MATTVSPPLHRAAEPQTLLAGYTNVLPILVVDGEGAPLPLTGAEITADVDTLGGRSLGAPTVTVTDAEGGALTVSIAPGGMPQSGNRGHVGVRFDLGGGVVFEVQAEVRVQTGVAPDAEGGTYTLPTLTVTVSGAEGADVAVEWAAVRDLQAAIDAATALAAAVEAAEGTAVANVEAAGDAQVQRVADEGTAQAGAVTAAGNAAVQAVQAQQTASTQAVEAAGTDAVQAIAADVAQVAADRVQTGEDRVAAEGAAQTAAADAATATAQAALATQERIAAEGARVEVEVLLAEVQATAAAGLLVYDDYPADPTPTRLQFVRGLGLVYWDGYLWRLALDNVPAPTPVDRHADDLGGALGLRYLTGDWREAGLPVMLGRRLSDDDEQALYPDDEGGLQTAAGDDWATWAGGADVACMALYRQNAIAGGVYDLGSTDHALPTAFDAPTVPDVTKAPLLVDDGALVLRFDGVDDVLRLYGHKLLDAAEGEGGYAAAASVVYRMRTGYSSNAAVFGQDRASNNTSAANTVGLDQAGARLTSNADGTNALASNGAVGVAALHARSFLLAPNDWRLSGDLTNLGTKTNADTAGSWIPDITIGAPYRLTYGPSSLMDFCEAVWWKQAAGAVDADALEAARAAVVNDQIACYGF